MSTHQSGATAPASPPDLDVQSEPWGLDPAEVTGQRVLDVRRAAAHAKATTQLPGAVWRDPAQVDQWVHELVPGTPVVVYCVHGHEVSRSTMLRLRAAGLDARFLRGGIEGWTAAGWPLTERATSA
jgi:superoxide dismutase, Fe-Mn family